VEEMGSWGTVDLQDRLPCHSVAPQTSDGNWLKGPVLSFEKVQEGCFEDLESPHFSLSKRATFLLSFSSLSLSLYYPA
jgi:hypothetical protein